LCIGFEVVLVFVTNFSKEQNLAGTDSLTSNRGDGTRFEVTEDLLDARLRRSVEWMLRQLSIGATHEGSQDFFSASRKSQ
jgi:hypothetical protein